jgi:outer membrane lipoprotein carrier protein
MLKKISASLLSILLSCQVIAADDKTQLRSLLDNYNGFKANFSQRVMDSEGTLINQANGSLQFEQPGKFVWEIREPEQESLISDGKTLWWLNMFIEQVSIFDASQSVAKTPFALLVSKDEQVWEGFNIAKSKDGFIIHPKNADNAQVIQLSIKFSQNVLSGIEIIDRTRQVSRYELSQQTFTDIQDENFILTIPVGVDIDDQKALTPTTDGKVQY